MRTRSVQKYDMEYLRHVGARVRHHRKHISELTQHQLALRIDSKQSYLSQVEMGVGYGVTLLYMKAIADGLNVNLEELLSNKDSHGSSHVEKRLRYLLARVASLNDKNKEIIINTLQVMLEGFDTPPEKVRTVRRKHFTKSQTN